jgi:hypothetical protein
LEVAVVVADLPGILPRFQELLQPSEIKEISIINHILTPISDDIQLSNGNVIHMLHSIHSDQMQGYRAT